MQVRTAKHDLLERPLVQAHVSLTNEASRAQLCWGFKVSGLGFGFRV